MHPKSFVFPRPGLLVAAALGCCAPAASAQVVIHPDWIVAYAFPSTVEIASTELAAFASPAPAAEPRVEFTVGLQLAALVASPEIPCRGDAVELPSLGVCLAPRSLSDTLAPGN